MKPVFISLVATVAILCVGTAIVLGVGAVKRVEADRKSATTQREISSSKDEAAQDDGGGSSGSLAKPAARHATVLKYEAATSGSPDKAADVGGGSKGDLERVEPRAPLSRIGPAQPPKPPAPGEWKPTILFQPVAMAAGLIEAKGYTIAVAGIEPVGPDETCDSAGRSWPCGALARSAFRAFLRGRAVSCTVPPQPEQAALTAECAVGKTDLASWLVSNGWARLPAGSPLADEAEQAKSAGMGIYGTAPDLTAPSAAVTASGLPAPPAASGAILDGAAADPTVLGSTAPIVAAPFPPAPAPPPVSTPPVAPPTPAQ